MNIRIHSFKVYRVMTVSGMKFWTFFKPEDKSVYGDITLQEMTLWDLLYLVKDGIKDSNGKSTVRKSDLEFLLSELAAIGSFEKITKANA